MPWVLLQGSLDGETVPGDNSEYQMPLSGLLVSPLNGGGRVDADVYGALDTSDVPVEIMTGGSSNEPFNAIELRQPGLYWVEAAAGWFTDWGRVRVNEEHEHSDSDESVLQFRAFQDSTSNTFDGTFGGPHRQVGVYYHQILEVDDRATDVYVKVTMHNESGSDRTYDDSDNIGGGGIFIVQLSASGESNPQ